MVNTVSTNPTNVPAKNHRTEAIPPLPFVHVNIDPTTYTLELRIVEQRKMTYLHLTGWVFSETPSAHAVTGGLLGRWRDLASWLVAPKRIP